MRLLEHLLQLRVDLQVTELIRGDHITRLHLFRDLTFLFNSNTRDILELARPPPRLPILPLLLLLLRFSLLLRLGRLCRRLEDFNLLFSLLLRLGWRGIFDSLQLPDIGILVEFRLWPRSLLLALIPDLPISLPPLMILDLVLGLILDLLRLQLLIHRLDDLRMLPRVFEVLYLDAFHNPILLLILLINSKGRQPGRSARNLSIGDSSETAFSTCFSLVPAL